MMGCVVGRECMGVVGCFVGYSVGGVVSCCGVLC